MTSSRTKARIVRTFVRRLFLVVEILRAYDEMRRYIGIRDIREAVSHSRSTGSGAMPGALAGRAGYDVAVRLGRAVDLTLRPLPLDSRCLIEALVLSKLLSCRGIRSTIVIGAHSAPDFAAHAWVEYEGWPVLSPAGFAGARLLTL